MNKQRIKEVSSAGSLKQYLKKKETAADIIKELQEDRRKSNRTF